MQNNLSFEMYVACITICVCRNWTLGVKWQTMSLLHFFIKMKNVSPGKKILFCKYRLESYLKNVCATILKLVCLLNRKFTSRLKNSRVLSLLSKVVLLVVYKIFLQGNITLFLSWLRKVTGIILFPEWSHRQGLLGDLLDVDII